MRIGEAWANKIENTAADARNLTRQQMALIAESNSFGSDLVSLSAGAGMFLQKMAAAPEERESRVRELTANFAVGRGCGSAENIAMQILARGFDPIGDAS